MDKNIMITGDLLDESSTISFSQVCHMYHISEEMLIELLEHGLIKEISMPIIVHQINFSSYMLNRIHSAWRLQQDLDINLQGVILALELRDELNSVRNELEILRRHIESM